MNRFRGLDLIHRMPKELWAEVCNIVQEAVTKSIPKQLKCRKAQWLSEEALQIAEERREVKGTGEGKDECRLNADFGRITRRDKKAFLSEQCKETEENRMGKTMRKNRDLFKKTGYINGTFHARMGRIKDSNSKDQIGRAHV